MVHRYSAFCVPGRCCQAGAACELRPGCPVLAKNVHLFPFRPEKGYQSLYESGLLPYQPSKNTRVNTEVIVELYSVRSHAHVRYISTVYVSCVCLITFLNRAGVTLSCRGSKKIHATHTWKSLEFNLDVGSVTLCLVPQLFMLELVATWCLSATTWI